ncbi:hypothetical protein C8F04DRAFT_1111604 [Mycena alexandri]|uniref:Uncharacterized protein n=1 Tax=Mycena alexandri TaxID=1745969 RepID=A0AAD6SP42_9AGAR|nr:hypothetical protein C8F04DRAFT_1111604 [Mycena alexandri]
MPRSPSSASTLARSSGRMSRLHPSRCRCTRPRARWSPCGLWREFFDLQTKPTFVLKSMCSNSSKASSTLHQLYQNAFAGTPDALRMAMIAPKELNGSRSMWYGVGGSGTLGRSTIPTIGIIPQPDYLWTSMIDGGWSKLDIPTVVTQINVMLKLITSLDATLR